MLLKSIEAQGFKSFADKTVLTFGRGITAVVGPNGSGKSNISDAVRWVLGEQSTKTLRSHKMEDVIFGGTAARRPQGFAEVTLTIDNSDRSLNFDNDTVSITRRYYRSGESEYQINKATVLLKNIHELFMDTGLGRDGYSMIGQGKIDSIVGSKSNERRDIFEEAAGISKYRYRKLEAERKLDRAEENLLRLRDILAELEDRVGPLAEQSKKAEAFLEYSAEKRELEIGLWLHTLSRAGELLRAQEEKIELAEAQYRETEGDLGRIDEETEAAARRVQELAVAIDDARRLIAEIEEQSARKEGDIAVLENTIFHNGETAARLARELETLDQSFAEAEAEIAKKQAEAAEKEREISDEQKRLEEKNAELQNLIQGSEGISRKIEELVLNLNAVSEEVSDCRVRAVTAASSIAEIEARQTTVASLTAEQAQKAEKWKTEQAALTADRVRVEEARTSAQNTLSGYELRRASRAADCDRLKKELDTLGLDMGEKLRRVRILVDLEQSMEGFSGAVKQVVKEAEAGRLTGVHGPVSRLIRVEKPYAIAVETALGNKIQNIVVDSEGDAKRAIAFLKQQKGGRATFLPVATIKGRRLNEKGLDVLDGVVGMAAALVDCDPKYREIMDNLLGATVVAEDIDAAVSVARKYGYRFKIVTLDGQVVNAGGSLTGGSLARNAGLLGRSGEIERLKKQAEELKKASEKKTEELSGAQAELDKTTAEMTAVQAGITTCNEDLIRIEGEERRVAGALEESRRALRELEAETAGATERLNTLRAAETAEQRNIAALEEQSAALQSEIDAATGGRDELSRSRERLSAAVGEGKLRISLIEKDREACLLAAEQLRTAAGNRTARQAEIEAEQAGLNAKNDELSGQIAAIRDAIAARKADAAALEAQIASLLSDRMETEALSGRLRADEKARQENKERLSGELARLTERREAMIREHDEIIGRLFDEYGLTRSEAEASGIRVEEPAAAKRRLEEIKAKIKRLGNVNVGAIEEYKEVGERYTFMKAQLEDVETSKAELHRLIKDLTASMEVQFKEGFTAVAGYFSTVFTELFGGGKGELQLSDPDNLLESGIEIIVQPPGKKVSSIELLSGGEKALIALSIYFAIMKVNPPPFCMLDEVETALDDINVDRFAEYLHKMGDKTQFICITHRRGTMEEADMLYGVTMQEKGVSKLLQLNVAELEKNLALAQ
ncbi:MAG: chromosome segregation protein SMC [Candidatus Howiella sp.]